MRDAPPHWAHLLQAFNPVFIGRQLRDALAFARRPGTARLERPGFYRAAVAALALLIGLKFAQLLVIVVRVFAQDYGLMPPLVNAVERETDHWPWWQLLLAAGLVGPVLEELAFRAPLRFSRGLLALSVLAASYYLLTQGVYGLRTHDLSTALPLRIGVSLLAGIGVYALLRGWPVLDQALADFWRRHLGWLFWAVALLFGAVHLGRYALQAEHWPYLPLIVLPQVLSALVYGYARMRFGLGFSIGMHVFANSLAVSLSALGPRP